MKIERWLVFVAGAALAGCSLKIGSDDRATWLKARQRSEVQAGVEAFVHRVAEEVTREGPMAWKKEFADRPEFFMASEGQLAFRSSQEATQEIESVAKMIKNMELRWGDDLRIDVLTPELAVVGTTWKEMRVDVEGHTVTENGYFTGVAEKRNGQWKFRDAHWSVAPPKTQ